MKITRAIIYPVIILLITTAVYAEEIQVLTWEDCVRRAVNNNPDLISAKEELNQAEADKRIAQSTGLPQISTELSGRKSETAGSRSETDSYSLAIKGNQLLYDGFKTSKEVKGAKENIKASRYNYAVVSSNVRLDLRISFVELLHAQQLISLTENIALRRKQNLDLVKLRYDAGREHKGSLLTAEADLAQAEFEIIQAKRNIPLKKRQLFKGLGLVIMKSLIVKGEFSIQEDYSLRPDLEYLADTTPFLKELIFKKEAARYSLQSEKADFFPKVFLDGFIGKASSDFPPDESEWSLGLSLSLPIFEGGRRLAEVSKAESRLNQAEADVRSGRDSVLVILEETWKTLQDSMTNVSVRKKFTDAAEERAKIASAQYETGLISFDDWIIIENNLVITRKNFLRAQADMLLAEAYWIQAIGGTLEYEEK
jgi:outer membrane protein TolC